METTITLGVLRDRLGRGEVRGRGSTELNDISEDSRKIEEGMLFVARSGSARRGVEFVDVAVARGAKAIAIQSGEDATEVAKRHPEVPLLVLDDLAEDFPGLAHAFFGFPGRWLRVVAVTGTNGKTTTTTLVAESLALLGHRVARIGTLGFFVGDEQVFETLTTPGPIELARAFQVAVERGATFAILEASSHALDQGRLRGVDLEVGAFLNLTQDHLDYHGSMDAYGEAKERLFAELKPKRAVLCTMNDFGRALAVRHPSARRVGEAGSGFEEEAARFVVAEGPSFGADGLRSSLRTESSTGALMSPLLGKHNLENTLVALGILLELGVAPSEALSVIAKSGRVPGRLERCDEEGDDIVVLVDYAHTPDALARVLDAVRAVVTGPVWTVFGCGGDRDRAKRPHMGKAASSGSEMVWVTSDNPRSEDPERILDDIEPGLDGGAIVQRQVDRAAAIQGAVLEAAPGTTIVIAGKGHETYQIVGERILAFDDRKQAKLALELRRNKR